MDAPLLYLDLFGGGPSSHLGDGGTGRRAECRGRVCCRSLEQLVGAARGLRDHRAIRDASARHRTGHAHTFAVRRKKDECPLIFARVPLPEMIAAFAG